MKKSAIAAVTLALVWIMDDTVMAQEPEVDAAVSAELEVTMVLLPQGAVRPDSITKTIELPRPAAASGANGEQGRDIAEAARNQGQEGLEIAEEARERGREFGQDMAEQARENREDAGRGGPPEEPPGGPPDELPGPPDLPQD